MFKVITGISHWRIIKDKQAAIDYVKEEKLKYPRDEVILYEKLHEMWLEKR